MSLLRLLEFSGAMNTKTNQFLMKDNELNLAKNGDFETIGSIKKKLGYALHGAKVLVADKDVLGMIEYSKNSDNTRTQIATLDTTIYHYTAGTDTWDAYTGAGTSLTTGKKMQFEPFLDSLFAVNGTDVNRVLTAGAWSTTTYVAGSPVCSLIKKYHDCLYIAGNSAKKNRAWKSDVPVGGKLTWGWASGTNGANTGAVFTSASSTFKAYNIKIGDTLRIITGTTATPGDYIIKSVDSETQLTLAEAPATNGSSMTYEAGSNWLEPGSDNGDAITGFGENSDRLLVFKEYSLHRWDGSVPMQIADVGTSSQRSVANIDTWTLFANRKGIYAYDGSQVKLISLKMQKFIDAINQDNLDDLVAWVKGNQYKLFVGDLTVDGRAYTNTVLVYDITQNNWWIETLANPVKAACNAVISGQMRSLFGDTKSYIYLLDSGTTNNGTAIDMLIEGKDLDFGFPEIYKRVSNITVFCKEAEGATLYLIPDGGDPVWVGELQNTSTTLFCSVRGLRLKPMITHADQTTTPVIEGIVFDWAKDGDV